MSTSERPTKASSFDDLLAPVAPAARLGVMRVLVGAFATIYLLARAFPLASVAQQGPEQFAPTGVARLLSAPLPPWAVYVTVASAIALSIPFLLGLRFRVTGPLFAAALLWVITYRNSFGMIFHTENLLVLHVIVLAMTDSSAAWSVDARGRPTPAEDARRFGFALRLLCVVTVLAYLLAGIAKLRISGEAWVTGDILRNHIAHDNLRKALLGDGHSVIGAWLVRHAWVFPPLALLSMVLELGAPLALLSRRVAQVWCFAMWGFHVGVLVMMWILFPYPLFGVAFASFFELERGAERIRRLVRRAPAHAQ